MNKSPLNKHYVAARLSFAKKYMCWKTEWQNVIFSDEKKFNLDGPDGFKYYFHDLRKEPRVLSRHHSTLGSVMVWGAISYYGTVDLIVVDGRQNAGKYLNLLKETKSKIKKVMGRKKIIFQHDNAPIHTSAIVTKWFKENQIELLDWPSLSPDLNIIENAWGWLSRQVYNDGKQYSNKEELIQAIYTAWNSVDINYIHSLYESLPNRIYELIRSNGKYTKY